MIYVSACYSVCDGVIPTAAASLTHHTHSPDLDSACTNTSVTTHTSSPVSAVTTPMTGNSYSISCSGISSSSGSSSRHDACLTCADGGSLKQLPPLSHGNSSAEHRSDEDDDDEMNEDDEDEGEKRIDGEAAVTGVSHACCASSASPFTESLSIRSGHTLTVGDSDEKAVAVGRSGNAAACTPTCDETTDAHDAEAHDRVRQGHEGQREGKRCEDAIGHAREVVSTGPATPTRVPARVAQNTVDRGRCNTTSYTATAARHSKNDEHHPQQHQQGVDSAMFDDFIARVHEYATAGCAGNTVCARGTTQLNEHEPCEESVAAARPKRKGTHENIYAREVHTLVESDNRTAPSDAHNSRNDCSVTGRGPVVGTQEQEHETRGSEEGGTNGSGEMRHKVELNDNQFACSAIVYFVNTLCTRNASETVPSSAFHSHCLPPMSVELYVQRIVRYCACSAEALLCGLMLLIKYSFYSGHPVNIYNAHRLLITSTVLGIKMRDDVYYSNVYYARIGGISGKEMNKLEVLFLAKMSWQMDVSVRDYAEMVSLLQLLVQPVATATLQQFALDQHVQRCLQRAGEEEDVRTPKPWAANTAAGATATSNTSLASGAESESITSEIVRRGSTDTPEDDCALVGTVSVTEEMYKEHIWLTQVEPWLQTLHDRFLERDRARLTRESVEWNVEKLRWKRYRSEDYVETLRHTRERATTAASSSIQQRRTHNAKAAAGQIMLATTATAAIDRGSDESAEYNACAVVGGQGTGAARTGDAAGVTQAKSNSSSCVWGMATPLIHDATATSAEVKDVYHGRCGYMSENAMHCTELNSRQSFASPLNIDDIGRASSLVGNGFTNSAFPTQATSNAVVNSTTSHINSTRKSCNSNSSCATSATASVVSAQAHHVNNSSNNSDYCFGILNRVTKWATQTAGLGGNNSIGVDDGNSNGGIYNVHTQPCTYTLAAATNTATTTATTTDAVMTTITNTTATTPGSGVNIHAQPYYYDQTASRERGDRVTRRALAANATGTTTTTTSAVPVHSHRAPKPADDASSSPASSAALHASQNTSSNTANNYMMPHGSSSSSSSSSSGSSSQAASCWMGQTQSVMHGKEGSDRWSALEAHSTSVCTSTAGGSMSKAANSHHTGRSSAFGRHKTHTSHSVSSQARTTGGVMTAGGTAQAAHIDSNVSVNRNGQAASRASAQAGKKRPKPEAYRDYY